MPRLARYFTAVVVVLFAAGTTTQAQNAADLLGGIAGAVIGGAIQQQLRHHAIGPPSGKFFDQKRSRAQMAKIQSDLNALGFDAGRPDGVAGEHTRQAIRHFQDSLGDPPGGVLSDEEFAVLQRRAAMAGGPTKQQTISPPVSVQPSFDCSKATVPAEQTVCTSPTLAENDRQLANAYSVAIAHANARQVKQIKTSQHQWLSVRDSCGTNVSCLTAVYQRRLAALGGSSNSAAGAGRTASVNQDQNIAASPQVFAFEGRPLTDDKHPMKRFDGMLLVGPNGRQMPSWRLLMRWAALGRDPTLIKQWGFVKSLTPLLSRDENERFFSPTFIDTKHRSIWTGTDEFERARTEAAFMKEIAPKLIASAPKLPMKVAVVMNYKLETYDDSEGGFPLSNAEFSNLAEAPLPGFRLPAYWHMDQAHAEATLQVLRQRSSQRHPNQSASPARRVEIVAIVSITNFSFDTRGAITHVATRAKSLTLYSDSALTQALASLPVDQAPTAVLDGGDFSGTAVHQPYFSRELLALRLLRELSSALAAPVWQQLFSARLKHERALYASGHSWSDQDTWVPILSLPLR